MRRRIRVFTTVEVFGLILLEGWGFIPSAFADAKGLLEPQRHKTFVTQGGLRRPATIIGLMILAVVANPFLSAPIALVAGAACGHFWGTSQVIIGAELGAFIDFAKVLTSDNVPHLWSV